MECRWYEGTGGGDGIVSSLLLGHLNDCDEALYEGDSSCCQAIVVPDGVIQSRVLRRCTLKAANG